jgi:hypothetical protein
VQGVIIRDGAESGGSGGLEFDLPEILAALGERVAKGRWRCVGLQYTSRDEQNIPVLEEAATSGQPVSGSALTSGIGQSLQVIDGDFEALDENNRCWVIIRAVDSSWWEVWSDDPSVLDAVRVRFQNTGLTPGRLSGPQLQPTRPIM